MWAGGLGCWVLFESCFEVIIWYFCFYLQVLSRALMYIPQLGKYAESILENGSSSGRKLAKLQRIARQAVAALCALGGFKETIKIGSEVQVICCLSHLVPLDDSRCFWPYFACFGVAAKQRADCLQMWSSFSKACGDCGCVLSLRGVKHSVFCACETWNLCIPSLVVGFR